MNTKTSKNAAARQNTEKNRTEGVRMMSASRECRKTLTEALTRLRDAAYNQ